MSSYSVNLKKGIKTESEHKRTYEKLKAYSEKNGHCPSKKQFYESIAKDHLNESKTYYDRLEKAKL